MNSEPCKCGASDCPRCYPGSFDTCPECGGTGAVDGSARSSGAVGVSGRQAGRVRNHRVPRVETRG